MLRNALSVLVFCRRIPAEYNVLVYEKKPLRRKATKRLANDCPGIAYKAACMLGLDTKDGHACFEERNPTFNTVPEWLRAEMARRLFWAVWYTHCINSDHGTIGASSKDKFMDLPLPMDEIYYIRGQQALSTTIPAILDKSSSTSNKEQRAKIGILGELMVLMHFW